MKKNKGFTLIELLVVIAIIGILASVVLAALSSARAKGQDAKVQSQLSSMRAQAELYYSTTGGNSYLVSGATTPVTACGASNSVFTGTNSLATLFSGITGSDCGATATAWSVASPGVTAGVFYCVDSTGASRSGTSATPSVAYTAAAGVATAAHTTSGQPSCN